VQEGNISPVPSFLGEREAVKSGLEGKGRTFLPREKTRLISTGERGTLATKKKGTQNDAKEGKSSGKKKDGWVARKKTTWRD